MADTARPGLRRAEMIAVDGSPELRKIWRQAQHIQQLCDLVRQALGEPLAMHVHVLSQHRGVLTLAADSAAVASELRYETPALVQAIGGLAAFGGLTELRTRVLPREQRLAAAPHLAGGASAAIERVVPAIGDPGLRAALLALARLGHEEPQQR